MLNFLIAYGAYWIVRVLYPASFVVSTVRGLFIIAAFCLIASFLYNYYNVYLPMRTRRPLFFISRILLVNMELTVLSVATVWILHEKSATPFIVWLSISIGLSLFILVSKKVAMISFLHTLRARQRNIKFLFETNVGAGLPIISTINDLINSGDKILKIEAVLSGTLNFIFNVLSDDVPMSKAVQLAKEKGYSEPDPRIDLSGKDVIRKLVILAREAGYSIEQNEVEANLFIPQELFDGSLDNFWAELPKLNASFEGERKKLVEERKHWRFIAKYENGKGSVALSKVDERHPFYHLEGSNNIILLTTERYKEYPMQIQGYGAGASVTAAGVFANIMSIANI